MAIRTCFSTYYCPCLGFVGKNYRAEGFIIAFVEVKVGDEEVSFLMFRKHTSQPWLAPPQTKKPPASITETGGFVIPAKRGNPCHPSAQRVESVPVSAYRTGAASTGA